MDKIIAVFKAYTEAHDCFPCISRRSGPHDLGGGKQAFIAAPAVAKVKQLQGIDKRSQLIIGIILFEGESKKARKIPGNPAARDDVPDDRAKRDEERCR
jgi:hypothetical protein